MHLFKVPTIEITQFTTQSKISVNGETTTLIQNNIILDAHVRVRILHKKIQ